MVSTSWMDSGISLRKIRTKITGRKTGVELRRTESDNK